MLAFARVVARFMGEIVIVLVAIAVGTPAVVAARVFYKHIFIAMVLEAMGVTIFMVWSLIVTVSVDGQAVFILVVVIEVIWQWLRRW